MMLHSLDLEISAVPALKIAANELKPVTERWKSENKQKTNTKPINKKTDKHLKLNSKLEKFLLHVLVWEPGRWKMSLSHYILQISPVN